ncbi:MAG: LysR family transcriptional regulator [Alphaproteobacteria bacterium]|nr:LysR family transcriptional regulator [Alphaproteobacteria bacterium]
MDWDKLKLFYHVARIGSFTKAATILDLSQPALSRSIGILAKTLNTKLFHRKPRGIELTRQGEVLYRFAHKMFLEAEEMTRFLHGGDTEPRGLLKVLTTHSIAYSWLINYIPGFSEKYPDIQLTIFGDDERTNLYEADVMIRPYIPHQPDLVQKPLTSFRIGLFASRDYLEKYGTPKTPQDLDHHRLISFGGDTLHPYGNVNWILRLGIQSENPRQPFLQINSSQGLLKAAKLGLGIVELGTKHPELEGVDLVEVLPDCEGPLVEIFYIYPEHLKTSKRVTALADYLDEVLKSSSS